MAKDAIVPGFRPGRAPRQLVEKRFRKQVAGQVKSTLLMACLEQLDEEHKLNPISQPELDVEAIELPEDGPMTFEMDVEVRPDFPLPAYKALTLQSPVKTIGDADIDAQVKAFQERYAQLVPKFEGAAEVGDYVHRRPGLFHLDGKTYNEAKEIQFRLQSELRFQDGTVPGLDKALVGVKPGDSRVADAQIGSSSPDPALRGKTIQITFNVLDLKTLRLPRNSTRNSSPRPDSMTCPTSETPSRASWSGVTSTRDGRPSATSSWASWSRKPPSTSRPTSSSRQEKATLRRLALDLRQGGLSDSGIRAREAELRANAHESTLKSLKEFFVLAKIAEAEDIKVEDEDMEVEIEAIADRTEETVRRVRARVEKEGLADAMASQILERKTIDRILEYVKLEEIPMVEDKAVETLDQAATTAPEVEGDRRGVLRPTRIGRSDRPELASTFRKRSPLHGPARIAAVYARRRAGLSSPRTDRMSSCVRTAPLDPPRSSSAIGICPVIRGR